MSRLADHSGYFYKSRSAPRQCPYLDKLENHFEPMNGSDLDSLRLPIEIFFPRSFITGIGQDCYILNRFENGKVSLTSLIRHFIQIKKQVLNYELNNFSVP